MKYEKLFLGIVFCAVIGVSGFNILRTDGKSVDSSSAASVVNVEEKEYPTPKVTSENKTKHARFMAVGDILIHDDHYEDARTSNGFNFTSMFKPVADITKTGDFVMLNQETPLAGEALGLSGLYVANSPREVADAEIDAGFNIFQLANNHVWDRGQDGLNETFKTFDEFDDIITSGAYLSQADRDKIPVIEENGIKMAVLSYSYGTNLGPQPNTFTVNFIDKELMARDIAAAKKQADVIVVGVHWGQERVLEPNSFQKNIANFLADEGVDIIIGTHPHVLQSPEWITQDDGRKTLLWYSLGNFLSVHTELVPHTLTGAIAGVDIELSPEGEVSLSAPFVIPTWTYFDQNYREFEVLLLAETTQEQFWIDGGDVEIYRNNLNERLKAKLPELNIGLPE